VNVSELRKDFPISERCIYFNTGWSGPSPTPVVNAMADVLERGSSIGPASRLFLSEVAEEIAGLRQDLGSLIGVKGEEIGLTHSTGEGLNIVYNGMSWQRGDKVITTDLEHIANNLPLMRLRKRSGVEIVTVKADSDGLFNPDDFEKSLDGKTKLVTISHVIYMIGTLLPVKEITKIAHEHDVPVLLDLAQSVGCIQFNLKEIGCDFAAARGGKWLLGPGGTGFLYVTRERLEDLNLSSIGYRGARTKEDDYYFHPDARRFEISEPNAALNAGLHRAVKYHDEIGGDKIEERIHSLVRYLIEKAEKTSNLKVLGTKNIEWKNGLVTMEVKGQDATELVPLLEMKHGIVTRAVPRFNGVRVSLHIFNTEEEIDVLLDVLKDI
jgi:selenocysteine lyase/cysteine desulfurase